MNNSDLARNRSYFAPEVVQTSSMDCGPAALKCLLEGFHIPVSYGRLREACQTDVDGTSIDTLEIVASQLGLRAEQIMIPLDHVVLDPERTLPAIVVMKHTDAATHFIVVWRRHGNWLQVMDPAVGRRWVPLSRFASEIYRHSMNVEAAAWRDWAATEDFLSPLRTRLTTLGFVASSANALMDIALSDEKWFGVGALDASVRQVQALVTAGGIACGNEAENLVRTLFHRTFNNTGDIFLLVPEHYWTVIPDWTFTDPTQPMLKLHGAVLIHIAGLCNQEDNTADTESLPPLSPELAAALTEKPLSPLADIWRQLREDGLLAPLALICAMGIASGATMLEALLFRGIFDISTQLTLPMQRLGATAALIIFMLTMLAFQFPIALEGLRHGRHMESRLRMALLKKLPRLNDRYFQSRPITDMADRNHNIHAIRNVPAMGLQLVQSVFELVLTFCGVLWISRDNFWMAIALVIAAMLIPAIAQPMLNERDLRVRNQAGALHGFYLDALLGLVPIRAHCAERNVRTQHESLLVEWVQSTRGWIRMSLFSDGMQSVVCNGLACGLLILHFLRTGSVTGADLLLVFWTLKLPAIGARLTALAHQYPSLRNTLLRLMEPLTAPEELPSSSAATEDSAQTAQHTVDNTQALPQPNAARGIHISIENGSVLAGGHPILNNLNIEIHSGEHIAIVGASGAGKSSLVGLLLGWHRLTQGRLQADGLPISADNIDTLRQQIAWIDPAVQIWNRSLLENLEYASTENQRERISALMDAAQLRGVAEKLPQGLQTVLGEGGCRLSGGEGQRVRLGRALLSTHTRLALLDEPFRGLDRSQRKSLLREARQWWRKITLICVTHDVAETLDFDRVLVIDGGNIIEDGRPRELAKSASSRYRALLLAERHVRTNLWQGKQWRRIDIANGRVLANESSATAAKGVIA